MTLSGLQEHLGLFDRSRFDPPLFGACDDHDGVKDLRLFSLILRSAIARPWLNRHRIVNVRFCSRYWG